MKFSISIRTSYVEFALLLSAPSDLTLSLSEIVQEQSEIVNVPVILEKTSSATAAEDVVAAPAEVSASNPSSESQDAAQAASDAGIKRTADSADDTPVTKAAKSNE